MLPKQAAEAQRKYPMAWWSLLMAMFTPMGVGIAALSWVFERGFPSPSLGVIFAGGCGLIVSIPLLLWLGAWGWLWVARRVIPRSVAKAFFIHPGLGILSRASEWIFISVYGKDAE